jgi:putative oxidoreductase
MSTTNPTIGSRISRPPPGDTDDVVGRSRASVATPPRSLIQRITRTDERFAPAIARLGLGIVILPHALQKVFGWFGGDGFSATYGAFTDMMSIPGPLAFLAIVTEFVCSIALILGALTRIAALGIIAIMIGAIAYVHLPHGFFMNWMGQKAGEGFEYHLLAIALGLVCVFAGAGSASVDRALMRRRPMNGGSVDDAYVNP